MKKRITCVSEFNSSLTNYVSFYRGTDRFSIHDNYSDDFDSNDANNYKATVSLLRPYDDADYTWARIGKSGGMRVEFIKDGKVQDTMQLWPYEDSDYESVEEYLDDILDRVIVELIDMNKHVEPIIHHD